MKLVMLALKVMDGNTMGSPASWKTLTSYLTNITNAGKKMSIESHVLFGGKA